MRNKTTWIFLLGIGIGIIFATVMNIMTQTKITESFIRQEAIKLGMIEPKEFFDKSSSTKYIDDKDISKSSNQESTDSKVIRIPKGMNSKEIATMLKSHNLISSEDQFLNILYVQGLTNKIRWGDYKIDDGASEEEIIDKIVKGQFE